MPQAPRFSLTLVAVALAIGLSPSPRVLAQELEKPEVAKFDTADGVRINGLFYRCPTKGAPAVIMLHNIGDSSQKEKWVELAKTLQTDFSVLTFDFRGHGKSTDIDPSLYFKYPFNVKTTKGASPNKTKLDWKDIDKSAYPVFVNDIAAAHSYLERSKNDLGMCNTQNTIIIGAEQGATLGAIWANSEWHRYKIDFAPPFYQIRPENRPEGQYLSALVALSISPKLGNRVVSLGGTLLYPCKENKMPALFITSEGDPKDKESIKDRDTSRAVEKFLKFTGKKEDKKLTSTFAIELKGAGKLRGVDLLVKSLAADNKTSTADGIKTYLKQVIAENSNEWTQRDFLKSKFAWKVSPDPNETPIPARVFNFQSPFPPNPIFAIGAVLPDAVEKNIAYDNYELFVGR